MLSGPTLRRLDPLSLLKNLFGHGIGCPVKIANDDCLSAE